MASGYDISNKHTFRLMQGRLGVYDKRPYDPKTTDPELDGILHQSARLRVQGGNRQQERMIKDKRRSLDRAVWYSYQAAEVVRTSAEYKKPVKALINPNKLKQDYDDKIISVGYEYNFKPGDIFEWLGTRSHWIIYLQDVTELAYFRGDIRKCSHQISWEDENGRHSTYAAIRGPVETKINYIQKHGISVDLPNLSLNILMPSTKETLEYFRRYAKFYLQNNIEGSEKICWRVEAIDWLSTPGILEINATEYYANKDEDNIEEGLLIDTGEKWFYTESSKQTLCELYKISIIKYKDLERLFRYETDTGRIFITCYNGIGSYLNAPDKSDNEKLFVKKYPQIDQYGNFIKKHGKILYEIVVLTKQEYIDYTIPLWFRFIESKGEEQNEQRQTE